MELLNIPRVNDLTERGEEYHIIDVKITDNLPAVLIREDGGSKWYSLPAYSNVFIWLNRALQYKKFDPASLPRKVSFKIFNNRVYIQGKV